MILSRSGEYGLQIVLHLAAEGQTGYVTVRELAGQLGIPFHFLGKICQRLTRQGVLVSYKGPNGGVAMAIAPDRITLLEVVKAIDGLAGWDRCVLGLDRCTGELPCPLHKPWRALKERILGMLSSKTVAQLARELSLGKTTLRQVLDARAEVDNRSVTGDQPQPTR